MTDKPQSKISDLPEPTNAKDADKVKGGMPKSGGGTHGTTESGDVTPGPMGGDQG
jgi:hypothetical protein